MHVYDTDDCVRLRGADAQIAICPCVTFFNRFDRDSPSRTRDTILRSIQIRARLSYLKETQ